MLRASLAIAGTAILVSLSLVLACNDVEVKPAQDGGSRLCEPGPVVYNLNDVDDSARRPTPLGSRPAGSACTVDDTRNVVLDRMPRGGWYLVNWQVAIKETDDPSGQSECQTGDSCTCLPGRDPKNDAGSGSGDAHWSCYIAP